MFASAAQSSVTTYPPEAELALGARPRWPHRLRGWTGILWLLFFIVGMGAGIVIDRLVTASAASPADRTLPETAVFLKPGPWGQLAKVPLTISAPEEILPIRSLEANGTRWFFGGFSTFELGKLLDLAGVSVVQRESMLTSVREVSGGLEMAPSDDILLGLSPEPRLEIYRTLTKFRENRSQVTSVAASSLEERFRTGGVSDETKELFQQLSCRSGDSVIFSGLACLLAKTTDYQEKVRCMKALTMQKTFLLRFRVDAHSDLNALAAYWGKGNWATDTKAILSSLSRVPGGIWSSTMLLMPPLPTAQLYNYPLVQDNPLDGSPAAVRDCHWTSFNFFRDQSDPRFSDVAHIKEKLKENYSPIVGDPRYGDIVFFARPDGSIIHSAVFMADDVVFTKNGDTYVHPWMLSTVPDLIEYYSAQLQPGEKLAVSYYRNKLD